MKVELPHFDFNLWAQWLVYCQRDGQDPTGAIAAWMKRGIRQAEAGGSIMPTSAAVEERKVVRMRGRE